MDKKYNINGHMVAIEDLFASQYEGTEHGLYFDEYDFEVPLTNEDICKYFGLSKDTDSESLFDLYEPNYEEVDRYFTKLALEDL